MGSVGAGGRQGRVMPPEASKPAGGSVSSEVAVRRAAAWNSFRRRTRSIEPPAASFTSLQLACAIVVTAWSPATLSPAGLSAASRCCDRFRVPEPTLIACLGPAHGDARYLVHRHMFDVLGMLRAVRESNPNSAAPALRQGWLSCPSAPGRARSRCRATTDSLSDQSTRSTSQLACWIRLSNSRSSLAASSL